MDLDLDKFEEHTPLFAWVDGFKNVGMICIVTGVYDLTIGEEYTLSPESNPHRVRLLDDNGIPIVTPINFFCLPRKVDIVFDDGREIEIVYTGSSKLFEEE